VSKERKYTEQFSLVGTTLQHELIKAVEADPSVDGKAEVVRAGVNLLFGLTDEQSLPDGLSFEETVARGLAAVKPERSAPIV
jgi:hypothetical protein